MSAAERLRQAAAGLADPVHCPESYVAALSRLTITAFEDPRLIHGRVVQDCERLLEAAGLTTEVYDRTLGLMTAVVYNRPELVGERAVAAVEKLLIRPGQAEHTSKLAGTLLGVLLSTSAAPRAIDVLPDLLSRSGLAPHVYDALLSSLEYAAFWSVRRLGLAELIPLVGLEHLAGQRERL